MLELSWVAITKRDLFFVSPENIKALFLLIVMHLLLTYVEHPAVPSALASVSLGLSSASLDSLYSIVAQISSLLV